ncbi:hypothetical protein [Micromonospora taraxaci]|uniref:hypothetical protein n=1 Tax=Micromonospora taraxaci TaxID=1316803 RepID=UPI0033B3C2A4
MSRPAQPPSGTNSARYRLAAGPSATANHLRVAQERERLLRTELTRVQQAAIAWRNGLGALLIALVGFGLVKGRSDISQLDPGWAPWVGVLLLVALLAGALGALLLIRAAHGRPKITDTRVVLPIRVSDHVEAIDSALALRRGITATLACAALLVAAVGTTWYGPERTKPSILVNTPSGPVCGAVVRLNHGILVLKTDAGEVAVDMSTATSVVAVDRCP